MHSNDKTPPISKDPVVLTFSSFRIFMSLFMLTQLACWTLDIGVFLFLRPKSSHEEFIAEVIKVQHYISDVKEILLIISLSFLVMTLDKIISETIKEGLNDPNRLP